jgi:hypothetical protein
MGSLRNVSPIMSQNTKDLYGHKLSAVDGDIGHVKDFYFDDKSWVIRYLVVDTASWLPGRLVLLSPHAFDRWDQASKTLHVRLTKSQIEASPPIDSHKSVSRQYEIDYYRHYGWPVYWNGGAMWGLGGFPTVMPAQINEESGRLHHHRDNKHLQSTLAVTGYKIQTPGGLIGELSGFLINDRSWEINRLIVGTGHWYSGKEIVVAPSQVERISYEESKVFVNLSKAEATVRPEFSRQP